MAFKLWAPTDLARIVQEQAEALASLPESITLLNRSLRNFATTVSRLDQLVQRIDRLTEPLEEPMAQLAPRLELLMPLLDEQVLGSLPELLTVLQRTGLPALEMIGQTQAQVATIAASMERLVSALDETVSRLGELPGVTLVNRLRGGVTHRPHDVPEPKPEPKPTPRKRAGNT